MPVDDLATRLAAVQRAQALIDCQLSPTGRVVQGRQYADPFARPGIAWPRDEDLEYLDNLPTAAAIACEIVELHRRNHRVLGSPRRTRVHQRGAEAMSGLGS